MKATSHIIAALIVALMCLTGFSGEEVLWWQVGDTADDYGTLNGVTITLADGSTVAATGYSVDGKDINAARVRVAGTENYLKLKFYSDVEGSVASLGDVGEVPDEFFAVVVPYNSAEYSFYIELGNWDFDSGDTWVSLAESEKVSYEALKKGGHIADWNNGVMPTSAAVWAPTSYAIPEPSGGMLMLLGGALLALRRRRRVVN